MVVIGWGDDRRPALAIIQIITIRLFRNPAVQAPHSIKQHIVDAALAAIEQTVVEDVDKSSEDILDGPIIAQVVDPYPDAGIDSGAEAKMGFRAFSSKYSMRFCGFASDDPRARFFAKSVELLDVLRFCSCGKADCRKNKSERPSDDAGGHGFAGSVSAVRNSRTRSEQ